MTPTGPRLSVVVPVHDEAASLPRLLARLRRVLAGVDMPAEIIVVDDASTDESAGVIRRLARRDARIRLVRLRARAGLTAAFDAGFRAARGDLVVTLDADLQNDPDDIPALLAELERADAVIGWRRQRRDPWLKRVSSRVGNAARRLLTGSAIRDGASSLRAIRRECLDRIWLLDGLHRFLPTLLEAVGCRVVEVPVRHHPRRYGRSKYGVRNRAWRGLVDLLAVSWLLARRLDYVAAEDGEAQAAPDREPPRRAARSRRTATVLALVWVAVAVTLAGWAFLAAPSVPVLFPDANGTVALERPERRILSTWVWWDAASAQDGWLALEHGQARSPAAEAFWQRRVHPGWNLLTWSDVPVATGDRLTLQLVKGQADAWGIASPASSDRYRLEHLGRFSGLFVALALAGVAAAWGAFTRRAPPSALGHRWACLVGVVTVLALVLRMRTLGTQSFWLDEVLTAIGAQSFTWVLYSPQIFGHPPLQYLVAWAAGGAGAPELQVRLPFVLAGTVTVAVVAVLGRMLFGPMTGLVGAAVLAVSPFHVELSQTARPYALVLLFTALSLVALVSALRRDRADRWLLFSATATLAIYAHHLGLAVVALEALATVIALGRRAAGPRAPAALSFAGVALLAVPWMPVFARLAASHGTGGELPATVLARLVVSAWLPQFLGAGPAGTVALVLVGVGTWALRRRAWLAVIALAWVALPLAGLWLAQPSHFVTGRHLTFILPILTLLMAHGVTTCAVAVTALGARLRLVRPRAARLVSVATAAALFLAWAVPGTAALRGYYDWRNGHDWRSVASVLDRLVDERDHVAATVAAGYPLRYYWRDDVEVLDVSTPVERLATSAPMRRWIVTAAGGAWPPWLGGWLQANAVRVAEVPASWSLPGVSVYRAVAAQ